MDFLPEENHVIFSPGAVNYSGSHGKVVEIDYETKEVIFEASIIPPSALYGITFHRTERMELY